MTNEETKRMYLRTQSAGGRSESTTKPKESIFGYNRLEESRIDNEAKRKHPWMLSDGGKLGMIKKSKDSSFGYHQMTKDQNQRRNQKKVSSETIGWWKVGINNEAKRKYSRIRLDGG